MTKRQVRDSLRLVEQQAFFSKAAGKAKWWHHRSKMAIVFLAALVPLLALLGTDGWELTAALAGAAIAIIEGAQSLYRWQEDWVSFRLTSERLKSEGARYVHCVGNYDTSDEAAQKLLAHRVEEILSAERQDWKSRQDEADESGREK